ncbi:hypothetical protein G7Z17_g7790 [Cylindrodendrum hubeiense]|uniref:F-box domain-containing protein n=1 Tax=Cylindrodendrum hubeiense TaxID=595255 RepID=A0A9P5LDV3_9HYPO|nr:hypothetical protein G7Z17_g7790 [Cylindrodendrum hubeiense]
MGQTFRLTAPREKLSIHWGRKLGEVLFGASPDVLVRLLAVPVRPRNPSIAGCKRYHRRAESKISDDRAVINKSITFSGLPTEVHLLIFANIESMQDVVCLGLTSRYFWSLGRDRMYAIYTSFLGRWANKNIVCVGEYVQPDDYPPELFSSKELATLRRMRTNLHDRPGVPFTLQHFTLPQVSKMEEEDRVARTYKDVVQNLAMMGIFKDNDPAFAATSSEIQVNEATFFPEDQPWILRNLTTKEFVRAESIALKPEFIHGPNIDALGFGHVVLSRICWSSDPSVSMSDTTNISRGIWAGHCFDITTLEKHHAETEGTEWSDVSEEIATEIAGVWETEFGTDWRQSICNHWYWHGTTCQLGAEPF